MSDGSKALEREGLPEEAPRWAMKDGEGVGPFADAAGPAALAVPPLPHVAGSPPASRRATTYRPGGRGAGEASPADPAAAGRATRARTRVVASRTAQNDSPSTGQRG